MMRQIQTIFLVVAALLVLGGCAVQNQRADYTQFRSENPRSILIVPTVNRSVEVSAPDYFLSTIARPVAERGYYVFPVHLVKSIMEEDGLGDANLVHGSDTKRLGQIFGADAIMYITIDRWDAQYIILSTTVTVELSYVLKSAANGNTIWKSSQKLAYSPQNNQGGGLAGLIATAIVAAIEKAAPNYIPLAQQANFQAVTTKGVGLPSGPYDAQHLKDQIDF
jgi:hypothetical protein